MKRIFFLIITAIITCTVSGQKMVDYLLSAKALEAQARTDQAIVLLTGAISSAPDYRLYIERAAANLLRGDLQAATGDYSEANRLKPGSGEFGLARIYAMKGDAATSLKHLEQNLESPFKQSEKEILLDQAFSKLENSPDWRLFWKKEWYTPGEKAISEIEYYLASSNNNDAKGVLEELRQTVREGKELGYAEALLSFSSGNSADAVRIMTGLVSTDPGNEKYLRLLAKAQAASSNPAGASDTYGRLLENGVADAGLLILRAECYRKTGETDKALEDLKRYITLYPDDKQAIRLAGTLEVQDGDNLKALEYFSNNLKLHPNDPECYTDRGNSYFSSKSWDLAIKDFGMSLDLNPDNPEVWLNMGIALINMGQTDDGCHDLRKALSLGNKKATEYISRNCIK